MDNILEKAKFAVKKRMNTQHLPEKSSSEFSILEKANPAKSELLVLKDPSKMKTMLYV